MQQEITLSNVDELRVIGATAMANADKADRMSKRARADMTFVIWQSLDREVHAFHQNAAKETIVNSWEPVRMLIDPAYLAALCEDDAKAQSAVKAEIIKALTGVDEPNPAQRACFKDACTAVNGLLSKGVETINRTAKGNLQVPYSAVNEPPKADAPESAHDTWKARKDGMFTIDGSKGSSFAELKRAVTPKAANDRPNAGQGKVAPTTWLEAVKAKIGKAEWNGHKGMDWAAYMADLNGAEIIEALVLYSAHKGDSE